jgi:hypothetical protein
MYCRVLQLWENGHLLPLHRLNSSKAWREGEFYLEPCQHEVFKRTMQRAKLIHTIDAGGRGDEVLPFIYDASVVVAQDDWMRVSGFYFDSFSKNALAQTWHIIFLAKNYKEWVMLEQIQKNREYEDNLRKGKDQS